MKKLFLLVVTIFFAFVVIQAQNIVPTYLTGPDDWRFERIDLPLDFAPNIPLKGFEELRFAPGMFDVDSDNYFTYVFVIELQDQSKFKKNDLQKFLLAYYKGLSKAVGSSKKFTINYDEISTNLKKEKSRDRSTKKYKGDVVFFDTFNDGRRLQLDMDIEVYSHKTVNRSFIIALVAPRDKPAATWMKLKAIKNTIQLPSSK